MNRSRRHSFLLLSRDRLRIWIFVAIIALPFCSLLMQSDMAILGFPVPRDARDLVSYPKQFKQYFAASSRLREMLAGWHSRLQLGLNGPSQIGGVVVGSDGWLYLEWMAKARDYRVQPPLSQEFLATWRRRFEQSRAICDELGVPHLLVLVPAKRALYPEHLPPMVFDRIGSDSGAAHMFRYLRVKSPALRPLNLLPALRTNKVRGPLFYKTDTHWNSLGAFVAARATGERLRDLFPEVAVPSFGDISVSTNLVAGGNEAKILGRQRAIREADLVIRYRDGREVTLAGGAPLRLPFINVFQIGETIDTVSAAGGIDSAIVFHNSFGYAVIGHLGRCFRSARWVWGDFDAELVRDLKPRVVIHLFTL